MYETRKKLLLVLGIVPVLLAFALMPLLLAKPEPSIPFVGMNLIYEGSTTFGVSPKEPRISQPDRKVVSFLKYYSDDNLMLFADCGDAADWGYYWVNPTTRMIERATWDYVQDKINDEIPVGVEYWIPTDVKIGSLVRIYWNDAEVVGEAVLSVEGEPVECWKVFRSGINPGIGGPEQNTWYYDKKTGLLVSMTWMAESPGGDPEVYWSGCLVSTNALP